MVFRLDNLRVGIPNMLLSLEVGFPRLVLPVILKGRSQWKDGRVVMVGGHGWVGVWGTQKI